MSRAYHSALSLGESCRESKYFNPYAAWLGYSRTKLSPTLSVTLHDRLLQFSPRY